MSDFTARIHSEDGSYWAEIEELPGCFASGETLEELQEALEEAVSLYLSTPTGSQVAAKMTAMEITVTA